MPAELVIQPHQYAAALAHPQTSLTHPELRQSRPAPGPRGRPEQRIGQHAFVYRLDHPTGRRFAVRCFLRPDPAEGARYRAISHYLATVPVPEICAWQWHDDALLVDGHRLPILVGPWADDPPLHEAVAAHLHDPAWLLATAERWRELMRRMSVARVAHGDLQHANVLVGEGTFTLIDPDGIWTPSLKRHPPPAQAGHPAYQHPRAAVWHWGAKADRFAAHVVYLSLRALAVTPDLWDRYHDEHNLIFRAEDFTAPGRSAIWQELAASPDPFVRALAGRLAAMCRRSPNAVSTLEASVRSAIPRRWTVSRLWHPSVTRPPLPVGIAWLLGLAALAAYLARHLFAGRAPEQPAQLVTAAVVWVVSFAGVLVWAYGRLFLVGAAGGAAATYLSLDLPRLVQLVADDRRPPLVPTLAAAALALVLVVAAAANLKPLTAHGPTVRTATHLYFVAVLGVALGQSAALAWPSSDGGAIATATPSVIGAMVGVLFLAGCVGVARRSGGWLVGAAAVVATRPVVADDPLSWPALPSPWDTGVPLLHLVAVAVLVAAALVVGIGRRREA